MQAFTIRYRNTQGTLMRITPLATASHDGHRAPKQEWEDCLKQKVASCCQQTRIQQERPEQCTAKGGSTLGSSPVSDL